MTAEDPGPPTDPGRRRHLLTNLAHGYFVEGASKISLGKRSGLSRFQVAALLQEAKDTGIVRIEIDVALRRADSLDVAVLAIGGWSPDTSTVWQPVSEDLARAAARAGAVAEVSGRLLDESGHELDTPVAGMVVPTSVAQLRAAHHRVGVTSGTERAPAVFAAVRGGW
ncbi:sugar-binding domain-containing protein [Kocuria marina]|uniref:sugar-binding domain-containing protein n=1 Tax=Kocuria marina TaxID=223184 RepID=UPI00119F1BCE|nr:sugar-binding domain-containing protein [Kocuria indica]